jgi:hypothetical protein
MSAYDSADERAIRALGHVDDWAESGLISEDQRKRMAADLKVDLRRTNRFLRATLFIFGFLIINAVTGLMVVIVDVNEEFFVSILCGIAGASAFAVAVMLVGKHRLYRFGIEEAGAVASVVFFAASAALLLEPWVPDDLLFSIAMATAAAGAFAVFRHFGYEYAAAATVLCAAVVPFELTDVDWARRLASIAILAGAFVIARQWRGPHGREFPGDTYAIVEAVAWGGIYWVINLQASSWLSHADESGPFYWATYAATWLLPAAGLWIAVRDKHRLLFDVNALAALVTLMTNKAYLHAPRYPWDPIVFGVLLIGVAVGLRRYLAGGTRNGFVTHRLLASEKERLALAGTVSVLQPTVHAPHAAATSSDPGIDGGGRSGGAGASGSY